MTAQKQRNDLLSLQNRGSINDEKLLYVVEEKHNGAFQVTKNAKQTMNYKQGQNRLPIDNTEESQYVPDNEKNYDSLKLRPAGQSIPSKQMQCRTESPSKYPSENSSPQLGVKKDYKGSDRVTNVAQKSRNISRDIRERSPKHTAETSGIPKPTMHESRIPLPKSCSKLDAPRSQSASPVPQRRAIPQRQETDAAATHPKFAWSNACEKQDNQPERPANVAKERTSQVADDYSYGSEDEVKVYQTENTPLNYSLNSSMNDLEDAGAAARCSLNIKTCTNVKLMKNHPLLANVGNNRVDDDTRLFEFRHASKDYRNFEGGKTVDFSVQSDYDIDENLSIMSRSSSVASISSFDQQSFHDDESFASDLSHHTSGIESPSELSDSPCQTVPSSPQKACTGSNLSDASQMKLSAAEGATRDTICEAAERECIVDSADGPCNQNAESAGDEQQSKPPSPMPSNVQVNDVYGESEIDVLAAKLADDSYSSSPKSVDKSEKMQILEGENSKIPNEEQSFSEPTESANFVTCASEFGSSSSIDGEPMEDISPIERVMLEKCIRAGLPQRNLEQNQGVRQKIPQLSYQLLRDTAEKHPKACSFESDRSTSLKSLDLKENEYESHSENEEKGKEDERKAEKKRLFRIPESPVDKRAYETSLDSNKNDYSPSDDRDLKRTSAYNMKVVVDQKGNRRCEKYEKHTDKVKSKQSSSEPVPSQLDFLMTSKKVTSGDKIEKPLDVDSEQSTAIQKSSEKDLINKKTDDFVEFEVKRESVDKTATVSEPEATDLSPQDDVPDESGKKIQNFEKDIDCCEKENSGDSEESMLSSSLLCEAREIAEALLGARIDSTEDMTVSTLSCLSDIDNARPPSVMGEMGSLSMTNSSISEENLKVAVTKECQKLLGKTYNKQTPSSKKSLLRELQIVRLNSEYGQNDFSRGSNDSPENLSMKSSSASDLLGNVNPPSILDDISLTTSTGSLNGIEGCDSECDSEKVIAPYPSKQDSSMSERMHDAAAMAQLYAKELSNITGNCMKESPSNEGLSRMKTQSGVHEVMEITIADVTEIGCDTIGSDTELEDDLPCDDEDPGSDTLQAPFHNSLSKEDQGDGSTENLTLTLTEEPPRADMSPYFDFSKNNGCFMTADEFKALQENADMILNTLREAEISEDEDDEDHCGMSNGDMLEDETMSLVSNESDEEFLSPDGTVHSHLQKHSPKSGMMSQVCNGMIALPQSSLHAPSKYSSRKTSLPQMPAKIKSLGSGLPKTDDSSVRHRYSYPEAGTNIKYGQISSNLSESPPKNIVPLKTTQINEHSLSRIKPPAKKPIDSNADECFQTEEEHSGFDSRTFTRKKSTVPKGMIPSIQSVQAGSLRSPSTHSAPSLLPGSTDSITSKTSEPSKIVTSKIAAVWKTGKVRSKSMVDANRNSKFKIEKSSSAGSTRDEKFGMNQSERSPSQTPSPQSPLSRSSTYEKLNDASLIRRPSTLPLSQKTGSPRKIQRPRPKTDILSPTSSNIPKFQNKAQPSLIPNRRSMIPTPAKFELPDN